MILSRWLRRFNPTCREVILDTYWRVAGRFDAAHMPTLRKGLLKAHRLGIRTARVSLNPLRPRVLWRDSLIENRLAAVDDNYPLASDGDVYVWRYLVVGIRRRSLTTFAPSDAEVEELQLAKRQVLTFMSLRGFTPTIVSQLDDGQLDIAFGRSGTKLTQGIVTTIFRDLAGRFDSSLVSIDTSRANASAKIVISTARMPTGLTFLSERFDARPAG